MTSQQVDYSRKWYIMAAIAMSIFLATIDGSIVNVALPTLVRELKTNFATAQWVVLAYLLTQATLMLSMGRLGDMLGKKPIYTTGVIIFTVGSVLCGLAPGVAWLIGFRVLQAIGAAMALTLGLAIVTEAFPATERGKALGMVSTIVSVGIVIGPTIGGLILDLLSWQWIFFVNLPVGIVGTLMALRYLPVFRPVGEQQFDYFGAITLFIGLLALLLALTLGPELGFAKPTILLLFAGSAVFLVAFVIVEWRTSQPMVDLKLFQNRLFSSDLTTRLISFIATSGTFILLPFYLENLLGYELRQVGLLLAVVPICLGISSPFSGTLSDRFGTRLITISGLVVLVAGYYAVSTLDAQMTVPGYVLRLIPVGIGMGVFQSPNNSAIMGSVSRERLGVASGLLSVTRTLGSTTGIAVLGALWASRVIYHTDVPLSGGATTAPVIAQIAGLQDTFLVVTGMIAVALGLSVWGSVSERRSKAVAVMESKPL
jgi:EmrB/QacA subfamily drug resistance transporter